MSLTDMKFWEDATMCPHRRDTWIIGAFPPPYCGRCLGIVECAYKNCPKIHKPDATVTTIPAPVKTIPTFTYYWRVFKWLVTHRGETNCRQKWRRMEREIKGGAK